MKVLYQILVAILKFLEAILKLISDWLNKKPPVPIGPVITQVDPFEAFPGDVIDISGGGFSAALDGNTVMVGGQPARVIRAAANKLKVIASLDAQDGPVKVQTGGLTAASPQDFKAKPYPVPGSGDDGPPAYFEGGANLQPGDLPSTGTMRVLVVLVNPKDIVPANPANARNDVIDRWNTVHTFYDQVSFTGLDVQVDTTTTWKPLLQNWSYYHDTAADNIKQSVLDQLTAEAAQIAVNDGKNLDNYGMMAVIVFLNGAFIRAWGGWSKQNFNYTDAASGTNINITANHNVNLLTIQESANWGRFAHETGHNLIAAPSFPGGTIGSATLGEDVYSSDLVDPGAATAQEFDIMGDHDRHPCFSAYHMTRLGYYDGSNVVDLNWDRNAFSQSFDIVAHGLAKNTVVGRCHTIRIKVSDGLYYYIEARQRPGATAQVFDDNIPIGSAINQGGIIVTKVLMDTMNNNQQTRFITLLHDPVVLKQGDSAVDPARALTISVTNDNVAARPLVSRVQVAWAQAIGDDPSGAFDLSVEPWNSNYELPDIWIDRAPFGTFDNPNDGQGRPTGNGDKPKPLTINQFTARVHNQGAAGASNVKVTFYVVTPPGVGDNGNWTPLSTVTVANIAQNAFQNVMTNWVPVVGQHTCLRAFASQQLGEVTGGNNWAQENVFDFEAPASIPEPQIIQVAVRNPRKEKSLVYVALKNVPYGYIVQFPHQWLMMNALEERLLEMVIVPHLDISAYENAAKQEGRTRRAAEVRVTGYVPREYASETTAGKPVGSTMSHIGGIMARVTPKHHANIELSPNREYSPDNPFAGVLGAVVPAKENEKVTVFLTDPDNCQWALERTTDAQGRFQAVFDLTTPPTLDTLPWQDRGGVPQQPAGTHKPLSGTYRAQAFLINSPNLAQAESVVVQIEKKF